ncbi:hypothetical protein PG995_006524 [Apiospora arundinis]
MTPTYPTSLFEAPFSHAVPRDAGFPSFSKLPIELRRLIWTKWLQQQRFITTKIIPDTGSGDEYAIEAARKYRHSKLLRVCREARTAALEFFSLRIPCTNLDTLVPLYFNPEYDVLYIDQANYDGLTWFADLLPKLTTYDSRGVGVLNLAIDRHLLSDVSEDLKKLKKKKPTRKAFAEAVSNLQQVWCMVVEQPNIRAMAGALDWLSAKVHHNRAVPVFPLLQTFARLPGLDPRPIKMDLGHLATFYHPQELVNGWRQLETDLGISRKERLDLHVIVAADAAYSSDTQKPIVDRTTARSFLEEEERRFREDICTMFDEPVPYWGSIWTRKSGRVCEDGFKTPSDSGCLRRMRLTSSPTTVLLH